MKKFITGLTTLALVALATTAPAQQEASDESAVFPVEMYACKYNERQVPAALDAWTDIWNAWADENIQVPYSAWTLQPFYYGPDQDFDFIWLGISSDGASMGQAYDSYLAEGGDLLTGFREIAECSAHEKYAAMAIKEPAADDRGNFVLTFSDCDVAAGKSFDEVYPALQNWAEYRAGHGSESGMWVLWPAYGGGEAGYDFKFAVSHKNYAGLGADFDQYAKKGHAKAEALFADLLECDVARAYNASLRRDGRETR